MGGDRRRGLDRKKSIVEDIDVVPDQPFHIAFILAFLKVVFAIYDVIVFIPFKIFADPAEKLSLSNRTKAIAEKADNPAGPWRHGETADGKLIDTTFDGCDTLSKTWDECVRRYADWSCLGTREVLKVHKEKQANGKIFEKWEMGNYHFRSYTAVNSRVNMVGTGLVAIGHKKNAPVVVFAETREEWMTTAIACMKSNFPVVTVYATLGEEAVEFAMSEVEAETIFTSQNLLNKVRKAAKNGAKIKNVIYYPSVDPEENHDFSESNGLQIFSFEQLLNKGEDKQLPADAKPTDIAMIMYTSGTTGNPKGVMLAHENILAAVAGQSAAIQSVLSGGSNDSYIGYLPLAHILEVCAEFVSLSRGIRIGYSSAQTLFDRAPKIQKGQHGDCWALKPTLMACVPAVMDRIYKAVVEEVSSQGELFKEMFRTCYERKNMRYEQGYSSLLLNKLVFNKIGKLLGGNIRAVLSGGAPLSPETQRFMNICFCCPVVQGYGLTETCGGGTLADIHDLSTGSVGPPLTCCEILLEEWVEAGYSPSNELPQGEILIGGKNVAVGYFKNEEKTKEDFVYRNGKRYFATGDIGEFREDGSLKIIDRKKDLLKLAHGEYISLGKVETNLLTNPLIDNICVYGDSRKDYLVALVVPNQKNMIALAEKNGIEQTDDMEALCENNKMNNLVLRELQGYVAAKLQRVEVPRSIYLCHEAWTPVSGLLTEALKLKRKNIEIAFREQIDKMYK